MFRKQYFLLLQFVFLVDIKLSYKYLLGVFQVVYYLALHIYTIFILLLINAYFTEGRAGFSFNSGFAIFFLIENHKFSAFMLTINSYLQIQQFNSIPQYK